MYLASRGINVSSSPRLVHREYSYTALLSSSALEPRVALIVSKMLPSTFMISTVMVSGNSDELDSTLICPLRRYFSALK